MISKTQAIETLKSGQIMSTDYKGWLEIIAESDEIKSDELIFNTYQERYSECIKGNNEIFCRKINTGAVSVYQNEKYTYEVCYDLRAIEYNTEEYNNYEDPICWNAYIGIL